MMMGFFSFFKSKEKLDQEAQYLDRKIEMQRGKADAARLKREAMLRVISKERELKKLKLESRSPQYNMITNNIRNGAGALGGFAKKTSMGLGKAALKGCQNYSKNMQKRDNMLNNVLGIQPIQPKQKAPKKPKKLTLQLS